MDDPDRLTPAQDFEIEVELQTIEERLRHEKPPTATELMVINAAVAELMGRGERDFGLARLYRSVLGVHKEWVYGTLLEQLLDAVAEETQKSLLGYMKAVDRVYPTFKVHIESVP